LDEGTEAVLAGSGLHRAALERIQDPPAGWRADGRSVLAELLQMKPVES
jgi:hypothetical protein